MIPAPVCLPSVTASTGTGSTIGLPVRDSTDDAPCCTPVGMTGAGIGAVTIVPPAFGGMAPPSLAAPNPSNAWGLTTMPPRDSALGCAPAPLPAPISSFPPLLMIRIWGESALAFNSIDVVRLVYASIM